MHAATYVAEFMDEQPPLSLFISRVYNLVRTHARTHVTKEEQMRRTLRAHPVVRVSAP